MKTALIAGFAVLLIGTLFALFAFRNQGRFVPAPDNSDVVLDTRTGQYCNPWASVDRSDIPRCPDLAKGWR